MFWLLLLATALAFGLGFALSWIRMKRHLQQKMDHAVEAEIRKQIQQRVLDELSNGRMDRYVKDAQANSERSRQDYE